MAITVHKTPIKVSLSGNPVQVKLSTDLTGSEKAFLSIHLKVQRWNGSEWVDVGHDNKLVDENGEAVFYIQDYLKLQTSPNFQYPENSIFVKRPKMIFRYRIAYYESYFDTDSNTVETTSEKSNQVDYYSLDGGIEEGVRAIYNESGTDWLTELSANDQFLTWQPAEKMTHKASVEKLFWLVQSASRLKLKVKRTNTDDSTSESIAAELDVSSYTVVECIVSPAELFSDTADLEKYEVWLLDQDDNVISEIRTYTIDSNYYERNDTFIFQNSFGACDVIWARGDMTEQVEYQRNRFERVLRYDHLMKDHSQAAGRSKSKRNGESELGYITESDPATWKEYYALEFLASKDHYKIENDFILPVVITAQDSLVFRDRNYVYSQTFKWEMSHASRYYSRRKGLQQTDEVITQDGEAITQDGEAITQSS